MEQFNLDFRKLVQILLYLLGPPLSLLQTRATREYTLCKIKVISILEEIPRIPDEKTWSRSPICCYRAKQREKKSRCD